MELLANQSFKKISSLLMPCRDSGLVRSRTAVAWRVGRFYSSVRFILDVTFTDLFAQAKQLFSLLSLVYNKEHINFVEGVDGLNRDIIGVAGADADDEHLFHDTIRHPYSSLQLTE